MPNYYSPYNFYPATYPQPVSVPSFGGGNYANQQPATSGMTKAMEWVEGEVGAKAFQMPPGWQANQPIPLWDSTDTVIYLKSWGPMGIPNPMQKLRYEMPEQQNPAMIQSGATNPDYVTKEDLKSLRDEIQNLKESINSRKNQNGSNNGQMNNRGGNANA